MKTLRMIALLALLGLQPQVRADLRVFACEPEWGALATELGGERVEVYTATTAVQDPHQIQARPSLIAQVRKADVVVCTGADLEAAWLPLLLRQGSNPRVQPGQPGHFLASDWVQMLELPERLDRAEGDVHPYGNPHIQTDPRNITPVAEALGRRLAELDPANADWFDRRRQDFVGRWQQAIEQWQQRAAPLQGLPIVVQHKSWIYLQQWLRLEEVAALEPKPGIPPASGYLAEVLQRLQGQPARAILRAAYQDPRPSEWLAQQSGLPLLVLPFTVGGNDQATDLFALFDDSLTRLLEVAR